MLQSADPPRKASAETVHLVGPGCLKVQNRMPCWRPVDGPLLLLHPESLSTVLLYGAADVTGPALRLLWRHGVCVSFLSPDGDELLGRVEPPAEAAGPLSLRQHRACDCPAFQLEQSRRIVVEKLEGFRESLQKLDRRTSLSLHGLREQIAADLCRVQRATSVDSLRGHEGAASARWHLALRGLFPPQLPYSGRNRRPPRDPVNALLSLGYTLLMARAQAAIAAVGLDVLVGFYHVLHPGRPALACDLIEPFRAPLVDRLVLAQVRQGFFRANHFTVDEVRGVRLEREHFRRFVAAFEERFSGEPKNQSFVAQLRRRIEQFATDVRDWHTKRSSS